ncbi:hypothetical protein [Yinghuangia aomiensis]
MAQSMTIRTATGPARTRKAGAALLAILLATAACSSSDGDTSTTSVDAVSAAAGRLDRPGPCPFAFDMAAALRKAGAAGKAVPDDPAAVGEIHAPPPGGPSAPVPASQLFPDIPATEAYSAIECDYRVDGLPLRVTVVATRTDNGAFALLLPSLAHTRGVDDSTDAFRTWARTVPRPGKVTAPPDARAAAFVRIPVRDGGDVALVVKTAGNFAATPGELSSAQVSTIADTLKSGPHT